MERAHLDRAEAIPSQSASQQAAESRCVATLKLFSSFGPSLEPTIEYRCCRRTVCRKLGVRNFQHGHSPARISENTASAFDDLVDRRLPRAVRSSVYPACGLCRLSDAEVIDSYTGGNADGAWLIRFSIDRAFALHESLQGPYICKTAPFASFAPLPFLSIPVLATQFRVPRTPVRNRWLAKPAGVVALY